MSGGKKTSLAGLTGDDPSSGGLIIPSSLGGLECDPDSLGGGDQGGLGGDQGDPGLAGDEGDPGSLGGEAGDTGWWKWWSELPRQSGWSAKIKSNPLCFLIPSNS